LVELQVVGASARARRVCAALDGFYAIALKLQIFQLDPKTDYHQIFFKPLKRAMNNHKNLLWVDRDINQLVRPAEFQAVHF
jgi:hypothetical protein